MDIKLNSQIKRLQTDFSSRPGSMTRKFLSEQTDTCSIVQRNIKDGFSVYYTDFNISEKMVMTSENWVSGLSLIFFISGKIRYRISSLDEEIEMSAGMNRITFHPGAESTAILYPESPIRVITLTMTPESFLDILGEDFSFIPGELKRAAENPDKETAFMLNRNSSIIQETLNSLALTFKDEVPNFLIEGLTMELLGRHLMQLTSKKPRLSSSEKEAVRFACKLLMDSMEAPPKLPDLAKNVGLTPNRLCQGFKMVYGTTPYAYLKEKRLNLAHELLVSNQMNVTEASLAIGYEVDPMSRPI